MSTEDMVGLSIPLIWVAMMGVEALGSGRAWPAVRFWRTRNLAFFIVLMTINAALPGLLPAAWLQHPLVDASRLGLAGSIVVGFLAFTGVTALMHRAYHRFDLLWRWVHQLHHSTPRLDAASAVIFTPQEIVINVLLFQAVVVFGLGLQPLAAAILGTIGAFYGMFQHWNIATPTWLAFFIQRPEAHGVHHRRGHHGWNYADFPPWDMLMGTFKNPREFHGEVGFEGDQQPPRVRPMLLGGDSNAPRYGARNRGSADAAANPA